MRRRHGGWLGRASKKSNAMRLLGSALRAQDKAIDAKRLSCRRFPIFDTQSRFKTHRFESVGFCGCGKLNNPNRILNLQMLGPPQRRNQLSCWRKTRKRRHKSSCRTVRRGKVWKWERGPFKPAFFRPPGCELLKHLERRSTASPNSHPKHVFITFA